MKLFLLSIILSVSFSIKAQKVIINGKVGNRPLEWADFTGNPEAGSSHNAYTYWKTNYSYSDLKYEGENIKVGNFVLILELDSNKTWIKKGKENNALLKHEQGHFDIGLLLMKAVNNATFLRNNLQTKIQAIFSEAFKVYNDMGILYDRETDHSKNSEQQIKWNEFLRKSLVQ